MRDLKLIMPTEPSNWCLDFDIINGQPEFVQHERNTQDQRAAIAAYMMRGSIPGMPNVGIGWSGLYDSDNETLISIDNEIKQAIQKYAGIPDGPNSNYVPLYETTEDGVQLHIMQG